MDNLPIDLSKALAEAIKPLNEALNVMRACFSEIQKLHRKSDEGDWCVYCEDDYPCRTMRVATGVEKVEEFPADAADPDPDEVLKSWARPHQPAPAAARYCDTCGYKIYEGQRVVASSHVTGVTQYCHESAGECKAAAAKSAREQKIKQYVEEPKQYYKDMYTKDKEKHPWRKKDGK